MMAAFKLSRSRARLLLAGVAVVVVVVAIVLWPHPKPEPPTASSSMRVAVTPVPGLPRGASACPVLYHDLKSPFDAGAIGTPMTSCGFVEEVRRAYATAPPSTSELAVTSPSTHKVYKLMCFDTAGYVTCTGGQGAVIYLYNQK